MFIELLFDEEHHTVHCFLFVFFFFFSMSLQSRNEGRQEKIIQAIIIQGGIISTSHEMQINLIGGSSPPISSVQSLSYVWLFTTPWTAARQDSPSITNSQGLLKLMSIESVMPTHHLILCCPLLLPPSIFPSIRVFSQWVSSSHQVAKVLEFQLQHHSFQWIFRTDFH